MKIYESLRKLQSIGINELDVGVTFFLKPLWFKMHRLISGRTALELLKYMEELPPAEERIIEGISFRKYDIQAVIDYLIEKEVGEIDNGSNNDGNSIRVSSDITDTSD